MKPYEHYLMSWHKLRFEEDETKLRLDCIACGKPMWFPKSKHGKYKTCSDECKQKNFLSQKKPRERDCATCGNKFIPRPSQIKSGRGIYCSQACNKSHEAMNTPECKAKAVEALNKLRSSKPFIKSGKDNPAWKGGRQATAERRKEKLALYKKKNKGKVNVWNQNRRKNTVGKLSPNIVEKLKLSQLGRCAICFSDLVKYHIDHIVPISKGGPNIDSNVQLTCISCNLKKSNKLDELSALNKTYETIFKNL
jgi:5-methylcytosine-specific restriction endonuclease McrA